ncbi:MAG: hypothetical protein QGH11_05785, partial [Pirellulaceae bacterium]|nr:hypothetical protein [Pirellulaceae bacterium]
FEQLHIDHNLSLSLDIGYTRVKVHSDRTGYQRRSFVSLHEVQVAEGKPLGACPREDLLEIPRILKQRTSLLPGSPPIPR